MAAQLTSKPLNGESVSSIVDILVTLGTLSADRAKQVKDLEIQTGKSQEEIITSQNLVTEKALVQARAKYYNTTYIDLSAAPSSPEALAVLPQSVAQKFRAFPVSVDKTKNQLVLAMADPLNLTALEFIEQKTGFRVVPRAAEPSKVDELLATAYTSSLSREVTEALREVAPENAQVRTVDITKTGFIKEEKVAEIVKHLLEFAEKARASDVHIEPQERVTRVRYRIDGILQEKLSIPKGLHEALISRIKILSGIKIDEKRVPQDGRFNFRSDNQEIDLRVSTLPTTWGEKVVLRLLKKTTNALDLTKLGLRGKGLKNLNEAILRPHGIILICGPTGSGKTTTLYSVISRINTPQVNIVTLEDPIEYKIPGVNQVQVNPVAGLTFASGLRSFLRQDPNIIYVGEIRDQETADLAIQASLTGHLVFSTLHTNNASNALPRLLDMGAEAYLLSSSITAIVGQRVVRQIDPEAKRSYDPDPKVVQDMQNVLGPLFPKERSVKLYRGVPSQSNNNSGYIGRIGIFEVLPVSEKISRAILEGVSASEIERIATEEGMVTLKQDGYLKALDGTTTIEEVLRVAQE